MGGGSQQRTVAEIHSESTPRTHALLWARRAPPRSAATRSRQKAAVGFSTGRGRDGAPNSTGVRAAALRGATLVAATVALLARTLLSESVSRRPAPTLTAPGLVHQ